MDCQLVFFWEKRHTLSHMIHLTPMRREPQASEVKIPARCSPKALAEIKNTNKLKRQSWIMVKKRHNVVAFIMPIPFCSVRCPCQESIEQRPLRNWESERWSFCHARHAFFESYTLNSSQPLAPPPSFPDRQSQLLLILWYSYEKNRADAPDTTTFCACRSSKFTQGQRLQN